MNYDELKQIFIQEKIEHFGITTLMRPLSISLYELALKENLHADQKYLERHLPTKANPQLLLPQAQTALVCAVPYIPHPAPRADFPLKNSKIAQYALGEDYHFWLTKKLENIVKQLQLHFPREHFLSCTDAKPVLERDLAYRAGLGWVGKNTCLIHRKIGSFFLIGEIYSTFNFTKLPQLNNATENFSNSQQIWSEDFCGTCSRCIEACPTQALSSHRKLDSLKCISYWTIEAKVAPPKELRGQIHDWLFGCDICQTICPWNKPLNRITQDLKMNEHSAEQSHTFSQNDSLSVIQDLRWILQSSSQELKTHLKHTALSRVAGWRLQKNAIIVATNLKLKELNDDIQKLKNIPELQELCQWSQDQISAET